MGWLWLVGCLYSLGLAAGACKHPSPFLGGKGLRPFQLGVHLWVQPTADCNYSEANAYLEHMQTFFFSLSRFPKLKKGIMNKAQPICLCFSQNIQRGHSVPTVSGPNCLQDFPMPRDPLVIHSDSSASQHTLHIVTNETPPCPATNLCF